MLKSNPHLLHIREFSHIISSQSEMNVVRFNQGRLFCTFIFNTLCFDFAKILEIGRRVILAKLLSLKSLSCVNIIVLLLIKVSAYR